MAVFVEMQTDPFVEIRRQITEDIRETGTNIVPVRRPLRGIEIKENSYAVLRVVLKDGTPLPVLDAAGEIIEVNDGRAYTNSYTNFMVMSVTEERHEKQQIVETFGDTYIFFFGEAPRMVQVNGLLLNTADFNWRAEWWDNYERYFRGTRLVEYGARIYLIYDDRIIEGYMLQAQAAENSQSRETIQLSFQMFVTGYTSISTIGDPDYPRPEGTLDYTDPRSFTRSLEDIRQLENSSTIQETASDAVRRASIQNYTGMGRLLNDALALGLDEDPTLTGFMRRAAFALRSVGKTYLARQGERTRPHTQFRSARSLRGRFQENTDEYLGRPEGSPTELAIPLSMHERWRRADEAIDTTLLGFAVNPTDPVVFDLMGRAGRAAVEISTSAGRRRSNDGVFQTGVMRYLQPNAIRSVPFGINAFEE